MSQPMPEVWRWVVSYEGLYEASSLGRVRSVSRILRDGRHLTGRVLKPYTRRCDGRLEVKLSRDGAQENRRVHHLVAEAFIGPRPEGQETRHLNDICTDNRIVNLCYGSSSDNKQDMLQNGRNYFANLTHCPHGHEYTPENTYLGSKGERNCRTCNNINSERQRIRRATAGIPCTTSGCGGAQVALGLCRLCYDRRRSAERHRSDWVNRTCPHCQAPFECELAVGQGKRKYCSPRCAREAKLEANREHMRAKRAARQ